MFGGWTDYLGNYGKEIRATTKANREAENATPPVIKQGWRDGQAQPAQPPSQGTPYGQQQPWGQPPVNDVMRPTVTLSEWNENPGWGVMPPNWQQPQQPWPVPGRGGWGQPQGNNDRLPASGAPQQGMPFHGAPNPGYQFPAPFMPTPQLPGQASPSQPSSPLEAENQKRARLGMRPLNSDEWRDMTESDEDRRQRMVKAMKEQQAKQARDRDQAEMKRDPQLWALNTQRKQQGLPPLLMSGPSIYDDPRFYPQPKKRR